MALAALAGALVTPWRTRSDADRRPDASRKLLRRLEHIEFDEIDDEYANPHETLRIAGVDVQLVNGSGAAPR